MITRDKESRKCVNFDDNSLARVKVLLCQCAVNNILSVQKCVCVCVCVCVCQGEREIDQVSYRW